jgi:phosphorylcholine metabolism protein LicD
MASKKNSMNFLQFFAFAAILASLFISVGSISSRERTPKVPFDFVMDFLKPIGMPLVTSYHTVRESVFLNARLPEPSSLESLGNFLLTPSQFLFAGKTISWKQGDVEIKQCFNYDRFYWAKALASLLALPIAEPLGMSIKGLAYLSSEVRERHQQMKKTLKETSIVSHLNEYLRHGIEAFHSDKFIPCQKHKRPSLPTKKQQAEIQAFQEIIALLDKHHILYWIDCGTCLGAYRYGGMIPWDIDIDIAILQSDHDNVKRLLASLDPEKYQIQDWSSYSKPQTFLKLYVKETKNLIDIYHYKFDEEVDTISYFYSYEESPFPDSWKATERKCTKPLHYDQIFPLKKAEFDGLIVWAPNQVVEFLQTKYGENLDPSMLWDEKSDAYVKVLGHPYWQNL